MLFQVSVQGIGTGMAVPYQLSQQQAQMLFAQPGGTGQPHQQSPQHQPKKWKHGDFCSPPDSQRSQSREAEAKALLPGVVMSAPHFSLSFCHQVTPAWRRGDQGLPRPWVNTGCQRASCSQRLVSSPVHTRSTKECMNGCPCLGGRREERKDRNLCLISLNFECMEALKCFL